MQGALPPTMGILGTRKTHTNCSWRPPKDLIDLKDYVGFYAYFRDLCRRLQQGSQSEKVDTLAAQTQEDVMTIIDCLRSCQEDARRLGSKRVEECRLEDSK